jgi:protein-tyrosine-phosphatase
MDGSPASDGALRVGERHGLNLTGHASARATRELVTWADLVLTMSPHHVHAALELGGEDRTTTLTSFAAGHDPVGVPNAVMDPFGGSDEVYEATFQLLDRLVRLTLERLAAVVAP